MDNLECLRKLYNDIESCVCNLKTLKIDTSTYGSLLNPILKEKFPDELMVIISRKFGGNIWIFDLLLQYFNEELCVKEQCISFNKTVASEESNQKKYFFTASGIYTQSDSRDGKCVFCLKEDHVPSQ